jgi:lipopolysaccharide export system permease protein
MIPVLWRYIAANYLKTFFLSLTTFVLVLLISRFKEIARLAAITGQPLKIGLFVVYQIPFILPMAIPLSALIAAFLLFQQMSQTHELTALRASGLSFKKILSPLLVIASFVTLANFSISGDIAPYCKRESKLILFKETIGNPTTCFKNTNFLKQNDVYLKGKMNEATGEISPITLVVANKKNHMLNLISAQSLHIQKDQIKGTDISIVSHLDGEANQFDPLVIETQKTMFMDSDNLELVFKKNRPKPDGSTLSFRMLMNQIQEKNQSAKSATSEILRRTSFAVSVLSFTLLGAIFGIEQGRSPSKKRIIYLMLLILLALSSFFLGKSLKYNPTIAGIVYLLPHLLMWIGCFAQLKKIKRGLT